MQVRETPPTAAVPLSAATVAACRGETVKQFIVLTTVERQPTRGCLIGADRHGCRGNGKRRCFQHRANLAGFAQPRQIE
jgi:hypothetical protein